MSAWHVHPQSPRASLHACKSGSPGAPTFEQSKHLFATEKEGVIGAPTIENVRDGQDVLNTFEGEPVITSDGSMGGSPIARVMGHLKSKI